MSWDGSYGSRGLEDHPSDGAATQVGEHISRPYTLSPIFLFSPFL